MSNALTAAPSGHVKIRLAEARDDQAVGELLVHAFVDTYRTKMPQVVVTDRRKEELRAVAAKRSRALVWVAEIDDEIVGTVALWLPGTQGSEAWLPKAADLRHLAVAAHVKGHNVSGLLLDAAERVARERGCERICLHVRRGAEGVARLYMKRGFMRDLAGDLDHLPEVFLEAYVLVFDFPGKRSSR